MSLKELLAKVGVKHCHIVDDAFDKHPSEGIKAGAAQVFVDALEDEAVNKLAELLEMPESDDQQLVEALQEAHHTQSLFNARADFAPASDQVFEEYLIEQGGKQQKVKPLQDFLSEHGISVELFGLDDAALSASAEPQVVFMDLHLREGNIQVEDAVRMYRKIADTHQTCRPFVFLFSTLRGGLDNHQEDFREKTQLFKSQFEYIEKTEIGDTNEFAERFSAYMQSLPKIHQMHDALNHVFQAVQDANDQLKKTLLALDLADYFVLHANTVTVEDTRLGSYMSDLVTEYLIYELEQTRTFWDFARTLDNLDIRDVSRTRFGLNRASAMIYSGNVLHPKKRLDEEVSRGLGPDNGYFYLGDIFFLAKELNEAIPKQAFVVLSPACDLARPDELQSRTVFLCEGKVSELKPSSKVTDEQGLPTTIISSPLDSEKKLVISWKKKLLHTWHQEQLNKFKEDACNFVRGGRMRPMYALQLQHAVTADLSRIGLQRAPSELVPHGIVAYIKNGASWEDLDLESKDDPTAAAISTSRGKGKKYKCSYVIADPCARRIRKALSEWLDKNVNHASLLLFKAIVDLPDLITRLIYSESESDLQADINTCYPIKDCDDLDESWRKAVVLVRSKTKSDYDNVSGGVAATEAQTASIVFKFSKIVN